MKFSALIQNIKTVHDTLHAGTAKAINISLTFRNWLIGFNIVEFEQNGADRAKYGEKLLTNPEKQFSGSGIKGMTERRFREYMQFYNAYPHLGLVINDFLPLDTIRRLPTAGLLAKTDATNKITRKKIITMSNGKRLELDWVGKGEEPMLEPRILKGNFYVNGVNGFDIID